MKDIFFLSESFHKPTPVLVGTRSVVKEQADTAYPSRELGEIVTDRVIGILRSNSFIKKIHYRLILSMIDNTKDG